jgi:hypothetical protein
MQARKAGARRYKQARCGCGDLAFKVWRIALAIVPACALTRGLRM